MLQLLLSPMTPIKMFCSTGLTPGWKNNTTWTKMALVFRSYLKPWAILWPSALRWITYVGHKSTKTQLQNWHLLFIHDLHSNAARYGSATVRKMQPGGKYSPSSRDKQLDVYCCLLWLLRQRIIRRYGKEAHRAPSLRCQSRAFNRLYDRGLSRCFLCNQRTPEDPLLRPNDKMIE